VIRTERKRQRVVVPFTAGGDAISPVTLTVRPAGRACSWVETTNRYREAPRKSATSSGRIDGAAGRRSRERERITAEAARPPRATHRTARDGVNREAPKIPSETAPAAISAG
jgi:hypothetical protein